MFRKAGKQTYREHILVLLNKPQVVTENVSRSNPPIWLTYVKKNNNNTILCTFTTEH